MLKDHLSELILKHLSHPPTQGQLKLAWLLSSFIETDKDMPLLLIKGYAGTGKTSMIGALVKTLREVQQKVVLMAPTGRAAKVFGQYAGQQAMTIHKKIFRQKSSKDGFGRFVLDRNLHKNTIFIVDEASMISNQAGDLSAFGSGQLLKDLLSYVYNDNNCRLILVGDTAQLPPVGFSLSPALDKDYLKSYGYLVKEVLLTEVVRQEKQSGILYNATMLRKMINKEEVAIPRFKTDEFDDVIALGGQDIIEEISSNYEQKGLQNAIVINRSNKYANRYNQGIRNQILWREEELSPGDLLMIVKNNYYWPPEDSDIDFIANGDIAEIKRIIKYEDVYDRHFAEVLLEFPDYNHTEIEAKIMMETLNIDSASLSAEENKMFFYKVMEDYQDLPNKKQQYARTKNNPHFNALQVKFAYAVTCHKSQGGQWNTAFIDQGYFTEDMISVEYLRWLYTAFTRATDKIYLVNFKKEFYE